MGKKCCVYGCKTNYKSENVSSGEQKVSVYRFPMEDCARKAWISAIPNRDFSADCVMKNTVVCELHWPPGFETISKKGRLRPKFPPSVWPNVPVSQQRTQPFTPRTTKRSSSSVRTQKEDELAAFQLADKVTFPEMKDELLAGKRQFSAPVVVFMDEEVLHVQSRKFVNGVPQFVTRMFPNQTFENFHMGVRCTAASLSANKITTLSAWSAVGENITYLKNMEADNKKKVLLQQMQAMGPQTVGKPVYTPEMIVRAFEYFATSRTLYQTLRNDLQLPSVQTLTRITSSVAKLNESAFSTTVFGSIQERQKQCIILQDEVYVKQMMLYHGGCVFGRSVDRPDCLAKTVLGIMIACMFGGPNFLSHILPVARLNSKFLHQQISGTLDAIKQAGGHVTAIVSDGNRNNQAFFKLFPSVPQRPWQTETGMFLFFDYVHLLKNIRNNWLTEATCELTFLDGGVQKTAKWRHLVDLYKCESEHLLKLSDLDEVSVSPKPVERQRVSTCLKVFSEKTKSALLNHPQMQQAGVQDTALFIEKVLAWWKILNVKAKGMDGRHRDPLQAEISDPNDERLDTLLQFGEMALGMAGRQGKRQKQLTRDTAQAVFHTCSGLVDLCRHLLATTHDYVLFGQFSNDPLEKEFSKLRQGSGGTYFINVQQIMEKTRINKAKLLLSLKAGVEGEEPGHHCSNCQFELRHSAEGCETVDNIERLEPSLPRECKQAMLYIAGYVTRKDTDEEGQTHFYYAEFGQYTDTLDRGGLNVPSDRACQWAIYSYMVFNVVKDSVCRLSFMRITMALSEMFEFGMENRHARILANIFLKNYVRAATPRSTKEPALKRLKFSESS